MIKKKVGRNNIQRKRFTSKIDFGLIELKGGKFIVKIYSKLNKKTNIK